MNSKQMQAKVEQLYTVEGRLNTNLELKFSRDWREPVRFLVMALRYWAPKVVVDCHSNVVGIPEEEWEFNWKDPSTCSGCTKFRELLRLVRPGWQLGECESSVSESSWKRRYTLHFNLLVILATKGVDAVREEPRKGQG